MPAMAPARCQWIRGACIAGKPGSYNPCWSWLACDGPGAVPVDTRRLHRGQARLLQSLLELACLRWRRRGASGYAASASRASPAPTVPVGAGLPAMASAGCQWLSGVCIAGKPGSYNPCWSWLACDDVSGVPVAERRLHRGQARLLQSLLELACLRWRQRGANGCAAPASRASPAPTDCTSGVGRDHPPRCARRQFATLQPPQRNRP
ncbi:hypothetical protein AB7M23_000473 [Pseudomonas sp. HLS-6 TE3448]